MRIVIEMGLKLGLRDQEIVYAEWKDIDWQESVFRVQGKPFWNFKVKDSGQREIPVPTDLLATLKKWHAKRPKSRLIAGTNSDNPNGKLLRLLKRLARNVGLDKCEGCKAERRNASNGHPTSSGGRTALPFCATV